MGCDIHQYVLIYNKETGNYEDCQDVFGEWKFDEKWNMLPNKMNPVFNISSRCYWYFGVVAGVRSEEFEIQNREFGVFPKMDEELKNKLQIEDKDYHSHTWYEVGQFVSEMKKVIKKIKRWIELKETKDPDWIKDSEYDEYSNYLDMLNESVSIADGWKMTLADYPQYDYDKTIIGFYFDS